jgi:hypothetical protein
VTTSIPSESGVFETRRRKISTPLATKRDLLHDLVLPTILFAALGGMTWAVRGSSGFGALKGCVFAGVTWGAAWWFISQTGRTGASPVPLGVSPGVPQRRYNSGWIILALTIGIGISGARGWMQWPSFFEGKLLTNAAKNEFVPISRAYGFLWLFIAGVPWAGLGACILAWCGSGRPLRAWEWTVRITSGFLGAYLLGDVLFQGFPDIFLPLHSSLADRYNDLAANPNLRRLIGDNHLALRHLGFYLGFLAFEAARRDWRNVKLILTVGLLNGLGWALCQNWKWAPNLWPNANVNFWRCWESSGGISIGIALGVAYYVANRPLASAEKSVHATASSTRPSYSTWFATFIMMLACAFFLRWQLNRPGLDGRAGVWAHVGDVYLAVTILYGVGCSIYYYITRQTLSDQERADRLASGHPDLDWLATFLSLLAIFGLFFAGELRAWSGWFAKGNYHQWYGYLYAAALALFAVIYALQSDRNSPRKPNLDSLAVHLGLLLGFGLSIKNGLRGWANIYPKIFTEGENYWGEVFWRAVGPLMLITLLALLIQFIRRRDTRSRPLLVITLVLLVQNIIAQIITGPWGEPRELHFNIYYAILFLVSGAIVFHFHNSQKTSAALRLAK